MTERGYQAAQTAKQKLSYAAPAAAQRLLKIRAIGSTSAQVLGTLLHAHRAAPRPLEADRHQVTADLQRHLLRHQVVLSAEAAARPAPTSVLLSPKEARYLRTLGAVQGLPLGWVVAALLVGSARRRSRWGRLTTA